jgi:hypothetical protein
MEDIIIQGLLYTLPAIVTGGVALYIFKRLIKQNNNEKKIALIRGQKKDALPIKLQAYERMLLFCERINPVKILLRVKPISESTESYLQLLIGNIEQEFEHNMVQQVYISDSCWNVIITSKAAVINKLKQVAEVSSSANDMRENVLLEYSKALPPTDTAIAFIKSEVKKLL